MIVEAFFNVLGGGVSLILNLLPFNVPGIPAWDGFLGWLTDLIGGAVGIIAYLFTPAMAQLYVGWAAALFTFILGYRIVWFVWTKVPVLGQIVNLARFQGGQGR